MPDWYTTSWLLSIILRYYGHPHHKQSFCSFYWHQLSHNINIERILHTLNGFCNIWLG